MKRRVISLFLALIFAFTLGAAAWADAEPLPEASTEPAPEVSEEPEPEASEEPEPEASTEPAPEASTEPAPEASTEPEPEASAEPAPEASAEPAPEASAEPEPEADEEITPAAEEPVTGECGYGAVYELIGGELHIKPSDAASTYADVVGFWDHQDDYDSWYPYVDQITRIVVEDGVDRILPNAFRDLTSVTSVELAESVGGIYEGAFAGCTALTSVELAESVYSIVEGAFAGCTALTDLTVRNALCSVSWGADGLCPKTTTIHAYENSEFHLYAKRMGNPFVSLGQYAASGTWDGGDWSDAPGSGSWTLTGDGVLTVSGTGMLNGFFLHVIRTFVTSVVIEDGISGIGFGMFNVFSYMENLVSVTIPSSVKRIDAHEFDNCPELTSVLNPDGTPWDPTGIEVSDEAFLGTPWLEKNYGDADGFVIINGKLVSYVGPGGDIRIPDSVTAIGWGVFYAGRFGDPYYGEYNDTLTSVVIPPSVREIQSEAFRGCRKLKSVEFSEGLMTVGYCAFQECTALTDIDLPSGLTTLARGAFATCSSLARVDIPAGATMIGGGAFSGCPLTSVTIPEGVSTIEYSAFEGCESLASVSLPEGLQTIGADAFDGTALTSVTIPESVTSLGTIYAGRRMAYGAFNKCSNLTSVTVLNKDCDMCLAYENESYGDDLHTRATVRGHLISTAQQYAEKYQYKFEPLYENDMTGDGAADIEDVQFLFRTILDGENVSLAVGDYCKDDTINLKDITALYQLVHPAQG